METDGDGAPGQDLRSVQVDNAIRAIREKKPLPQIDFTIHNMEDGTQVSTMERVCKGAIDPAVLATASAWRLRAPTLPSCPSTRLTFMLYL